MTNVPQSALVPKMRSSIHYSFDAHRLTMKQAVWTESASDSFHGELKERVSIWMRAQFSRLYMSSFRIC